MIDLIKQMREEGIAVNKKYIQRNNDSPTLGLESGTPFFIESAPWDVNQRLAELLLTSDGKPLSFVRKGSTDSGPAGLAGGPCDIYVAYTQDGGEYGIIVVNDYCDETTAQPPIGYSFAKGTSRSVASSNEIPLKKEPTATPAIDTTGGKDGNKKRRKLVILLTVALIICASAIGIHIGLSGEKDNPAAGIKKMRETAVGRADTDIIINDERELTIAADNRNADTPSEEENTTSENGSSANINVPDFSSLWDGVYDGYSYDLATEVLDYYHDMYYVFDVENNTIKYTSGTYTYEFAITEIDEEWITCHNIAAPEVIWHFYRTDQAILRAEKDFTEITGTQTILIKRSSATGVEPQISSLWDGKYEAYSFDIETETLTLMNGVQYIFNTANDTMSCVLGNTYVFVITEINAEWLSCYCNANPDVIWRFYRGSDGTLLRYDGEQAMYKEILKKIQ